MHSTMNLGGSVVSKNILEKRGRVKWCFREESVNNIDNGWRFLSEIDTDEFLADSKNMVICDWGTIFEIEPAIAPIFDLKWSESWNPPVDNFGDTKQRKSVEPLLVLLAPGFVEPPSLLILPPSPF